jgi:dGTPase
MDWADDVTYAVHDVVDFYRAGQIPLDRLAHEAGQEKGPRPECERFLSEVFSRRKKIRAKRRLLEAAFRDVIELFAAIDRPYDGSLSQRRDLWQLITILISRYVNVVSLSTSSSLSSSFVCEQWAKDEIFMLKELTWHYVLLRHDLAAQQYGQRQAIRTVWNTLLAGARKKREWTIFPLEYREDLDRAQGRTNLLTRTVTDFVASMSESEIMRLYRLFRGRA